MPLENYAAMIDQFDPVKIDQQIATTRGLQNTNRLAEFAFAQKQREADMTNERERITRESVDEPTGRLDSSKYRLGLLKSGDYSGAQAFDKSQAEQAKMQREAEKERIASAKSQIELVGQVAGAVKDQSSYTAGLETLKQAGIDISQLPQQYDPGYVSQARQQALTAAQQVEQVWKEKGYNLDVDKFGYQKTNDAANRDVTMRGQDITERGLNMANARGIEANSIAREKTESVAAKPLPAPVLKQLTEVRDNATTINNLASSFKPGYAGKGVLGMGADLQMDASARMGVDNDAVDWWKNYKKQAELVERHAMFGASLTPGEQNSWRSADIAPGMDPKVIERNLATRNALSKKVFENSTQDLIDAGHNADRITKISGRGNNPVADVSKSKPPGNAAPISIKTDADYAALPSGATFISPDGKTRRKP